MEELPLFHKWNRNTFLIMLRTLGITAVFSLFVVGCGSTPEQSSSLPEPYFPVQKETPEELLAALLPGILEMDSDGYLRVLGKLVLWPKGYSCKRDRDALCILDEKGDSVVCVGDNVSIGGGEIPEHMVNDTILPELPKGCTGPFWLASSVTKENS